MYRHRHRHRLASRALIALTLLIGLMPGLARSAEETPVPPSGEAARFLPSADAFGAGWRMARTAGLDVDTDVFRDGAVAVLTGPDGARVVAAVMLVTQDRVAVRRSWEAADKLYDNYAGELAYLTGREQELDGDAPPSGCVEAKRIDGTAKQLGIDTGIPLGITMCAADPDVIVLAIASGTVLDITGFPASDAVVALMVASRSATPAPEA